MKVVAPEEYKKELIDIAEKFLSNYDFRCLHDQLWIFCLTFQHLSFLQPYKYNIASFRHYTQIDTMHTIYNVLLKVPLSDQILFRRHFYNEKKCISSPLSQAPIFYLHIN